MSSSLFAVMLAAQVVLGATTTSLPGAAQFTVPAAFPTSIFSSYYGVCCVLCSIAYVPGSLRLTPWPNSETGTYSGAPARLI